MKMPSMPESDKVIAAAPESQKLGEFLDWLREQGIHLAKYVPVLDPPVRYHVVPCPKCPPDCWRVKDRLSLSLNGLTPYHFEDEEDAKASVILLEEERQQKAEADPVFQPFYGSTERLLAEYFEIDLDKVEQERRALLDAMRKPS